MLRTIFFAACVAVMTTTNAINLEEVDGGLQQQFAQSDLDQGDRSKALKVLGTTEKEIKNKKALDTMGTT